MRAVVKRASSSPGLTYSSRWSRTTPTRGPEATRPTSSWAGRRAARPAQEDVGRVASGPLVGVVKLHQTSM